MKAVPLLPLLGAVLGAAVSVPVNAAEQPAASDRVPRQYIKRLVGLPGETVIIKEGVVSTVSSATIERITIEGGKVEIKGDTIKIDGGRVEIIRQVKP